LKEPAVNKFHTCPGAAVRDFTDNAPTDTEESGQRENRPSQLRQWPVQLMLVPVAVPYFNGAELVITADCVPFAYAGFHENFLKGKVVLVGCPKLDDAGHYKNKLTEIFRGNNIKSVTCLHMEVPCCFGLVKLVSSALAESGKDIPLSNVEISIHGKVKSENLATAII